MGVLGKDLLDFHRPRTNTKVEFGASGYWVESHPTMQPYGAVLTEILTLRRFKNYWINIGRSLQKRMQSRQRGRFRLWRMDLRLCRFTACIGMTFSCLQAWMWANCLWETRRKRSANM